MKRALVTGCTGMDGSHLVDLLLSKGYTVHGLIRRSSSRNTTRIDHAYQDPHEADARLVLHYGDLTDGTSLARILRLAEPDEVYNLGAQSHVRISFDAPEYTCDAVGMGTLRLLEAIRDSGRRPRIYQASSSEMFGSAPAPHSEATPFHPRSPYAAAKAFAHHVAVNYREAYGLHVSCGILFNHTSTRRGETFLTRKVSRAVAAIAAGRQMHLYLGNLDARRDWGWAPEFVEAMFLMLQQEQPDDYVIATGETHSVREFVSAAFSAAGLDWQEHVRIDPRYYRPAEVDVLQGDASKARRVLGWAPRVTFAEIARRMVAADIEALRCS